MHRSSGHVAALAFVLAIWKLHVHLISPCYGEHGSAWETGGRGPWDSGGRACADGFLCRHVPSTQFSICRFFFQWFQTRCVQMVQIQDKWQLSQGLRWTCHRETNVCVNWTPGTHQWNHGNQSWDTNPCTCKFAIWCNLHVFFCCFTLRGYCTTMQA